MSNTQIYSNLPPAIFAGLEKELVDSHQAVMTAAPTAPNGTESGIIVHDNVHANYTYVGGTLTVNITEGGGMITNHVIHSRIEAAIATLVTAAQNAAKTPSPAAAAAAVKPAA
jgi:hypothetical protein